MDLFTVETYLCPTQLKDIPAWSGESAWLAGGTWLFSEPRPNLKTVVDITRLGWSELEVTPEGLAIGATCVLSELLRSTYPAAWKGVTALQQAVHELASFKVQNVATVGGNLCLAIPAGTVAPAMLLLNATYEIVSPQGDSYWVSAQDFQTGARTTVLKPGDLLRKVKIPHEYLEWRVSYQRLCVASAGLGIAIVAAAYNPNTAQVRFAIGAAVPSPQLIELDRIPTAGECLDVLDRHIAHDRFLQDELASANYRRQVTQVLMQRSLQDVLNQT